MQTFYRENNVADRLTSMHRNMIRQQSKPPLLRASAAQVRALVPCGHELAARFLRDTPEDEAAVAGAFHLGNCYKAVVYMIVFVGVWVTQNKWDTIRAPGKLRTEGP